MTTLYVEKPTGKDFAGPQASRHQNWSHFHTPENFRTAQFMTALPIINHLGMDSMSDMNTLQRCKETDSKFMEHSRLVIQ